MSKEVIVRLRDDLDNSVGGDIETCQFSWAGKNYEIDLTAEHFAEFEFAILPYIKAGREVKRRRKTTSTPRSKGYRWPEEISSYAAKLGYNWDDKAQRQDVRTWALANGHCKNHTGVLPKEALDAYHEAHN
jgi:hypothetical protein